MEPRGRPTQHFDALDRPGIEREGDAHAPVLAQPVIQPHHRRPIGETTAGQRTQPVAGMRHGADRTCAADRIVEVGIAALLQLVAADDGERGRRLQHAQAQRGTGAGGGGQLAAAGIHHAHGIQRGGRRRIGGKGRRRLQKPGTQRRQQRPAQARGVGVGFHWVTACKATPHCRAAIRKG
ncbi:hypothetical protein G6F40_015456 [Rhizopus arrhizus]|nr:hypothetical protein G6F40_015456 [Rhizopus arrhizus]